MFQWYRTAGHLTKDFGQFARQLLPSKPDQVRRGHHSDVIQRESPQVQGLRLVVRPRKMYGDGGGDERPQHVDELGRRTAGAKTDANEVPRVDPTSPALTVRVDALRDLVAIVIEHRSVFVVMVLFCLRTFLLREFIGVGDSNVCFGDPICRCVCGRLAALSAKCHSG